MQIHVAYSSETGTARSLAKDFLSQCLAQYQVHSFSEIAGGMQLDPTKIWVFFIATTGQGQFPFSMRSYWARLMLKNYTLKGSLKFAIFSLGDSSYGDNFGVAARKFRQRLKMLGCEQLVEIGLGDEQDALGYRTVYNGWRQEVLLQFGKYAMTLKNESSLIWAESANSVSWMKIGKVKEINSRKARRTFFVDMHYPEELQVSVGDVLCVYPHNSPATVQKIMEYFSIKDQGQVVAYQGKEVPLIQLLTKVVDLSSTVPYEFFTSKVEGQSLWACLEGELHRGKIAEIANDYSEYFDYVRRYKRNVLEVLQDFPFRMTIRQFIARMAPIFPRKYSVAQLEPPTASLLIRLVESEINVNKIHRGFCTHDLVAHSGAYRKVVVHHGEFHLKRPQSHQLLVALGTGIAPFIPILRHSSNSKLYYSNKFSDQIYHRQVTGPTREFQEVLLFTQEGGERISKKLMGDTEQMAALIERVGLSNFCVLVCGPKQICEFVRDWLAKITGLSKGELKKRGAIVCESW